MYNEYLQKPKRFLILKSPHLPAATLNFSKRYTSFVKLQYVKARDDFTKYLRYLTVDGFYDTTAGH